MTTSAGATPERSPPSSGEARGSLRSLSLVRYCSSYQSMSSLVRMKPSANSRREGASREKSVAG